MTTDPRSLTDQDAGLIMAALGDYADTLDSQALDLMQGPDRRWREQQASRCRELVELLAHHSVMLD